MNKSKYILLGLFVAVVAIGGFFAMNRKTVPQNKPVVITVATSTEPTKPVAKNPVISTEPIDTSKWREYTELENVVGFSFRIPDTTKVDPNPQGLFMSLVDSGSNGYLAFTGAGYTKDEYKGMQPLFYTDSGFPVYFQEEKDDTSGNNPHLARYYSVVDIKNNFIAWFKVEVGYDNQPILGIPFEQNLFRKDYTEAIIKTVKISNPPHWVPLRGA